jgi:tripartite ATP-independent transporter DctP family solute receptor
MKQLSRRQVISGFAKAGIAMPFLNLGRASAAEFTFKYGGILSTEHPLTKGVVKAAEQIRTATNGRVDIQVFPNSQLGSEMDMLSQLRSGALEFMTNSGLLLSSLVPTASLPGVAYAFGDYADVWKAMDGELGAYVRRNIEKANLVVFDRIWNGGFFNLMSSSKPIQTPVDVRGVKLRVPQGPMWISMYKALGAAPAAISWGEVYTALQTKVVDGVDASLTALNDAKLYEVQKNLTLTNHIWDGFWMLANRRAVERLPADLRDIVAKTFIAAALVQRAEVEKIASDVVEQFGKRGVKVYRADKAAFQDVLKKNQYYADWRAKFGEEPWSLLERSIGKKLGSKSWPPTCK